MTAAQTQDHEQTPEDLATRIRDEIIIPASGKRCLFVGGESMALLSLRSSNCWLTVW